MKQNKGKTTDNRQQTTEQDKRQQDKENGNSDFQDRVGTAVSQSHHKL